MYAVFRLYYAKPEKPQQNCMFTKWVAALLRWEAANLGWVGGGGLGGWWGEAGEDLRA